MFTKIRNATIVSSLIVLASFAPSHAVTMWDVSLNDGTLVSTNPSATGSSAHLEFKFEQVGTTADVRLTVSVDNTTGDGAPFGSGATASKLLGFAFTVPDLVGLSTSAGNFVGSTGGYFTNLLQNDASINGGPFQNVTFDLGAGNKTTLESAGSPNGGLDPGDGTVGVQFLLSGLGETAMSHAFETGFGSGDLLLGLRFKAVNAGAGSDKVVYLPPDENLVSQPIPASLVLMISAMVGMVLLRRRSFA